MSKELIHIFDPKLKYLEDQKVEAIYMDRLVVGSLWFAGVNSLHGQYQITLNRTPYWPVDPTTIKLFVPRIRIHEEK